MPRSERPDMAGYGVTDDPEGVLPWSWAEAQLAASRNFWLVTVSGAGRPHAMPVWGVWIPATERFAFSCSPTARKVRNITANDQVVITGQDTVNVVSIEGSATRLVADEDIDRAGRAWFGKYTDEPGFDDVDAALAFLRQNAFFEVTPDRAFGIIEEPDKFSEQATRWVWD